MKDDGGNGKEGNKDEPADTLDRLALGVQDSQTYDGLRNAGDAKRRLDYLWKERKRWQDNGHEDIDCSGDISEELDGEKENYHSTVEEIILEDKSPVMRSFIKIGLRIGYMTPEKQAAKDKRKLEHMARNYRRLDDKVRKEIKTSVKEIDVLETRLAQTYEFDMKSEQVLEAERAEIAKLKDEIAGIIKGNYNSKTTKDTKDPKKFIERKKAKIRASEEYIRDMERKQMDNVFDEQYLRASLDESRDWYSSLEIESKRMLNNLYRTKEQVLPVRSVTKIAERKKSSLKIDDITKSIGDHAINLANTIKEHNYRVEAISLDKVNSNYDEDSNSVDGVNNAYNDAKVRRDEVITLFEKNQSNRLELMKQRRHQYFE